MRIIFTLVCLFICGFGVSQTNSKLKKQLQTELKKMQSQGATFQDITDKFFITEVNQYVLSLEDYLRKELYLEYMKSLYISKKISEGSITDEDDALINKSNSHYNNYQEYLDYKKTPEAIERWEWNLDNGILKLVVSDIDNYNEADKERYKDLKGLFDRDTFFTSFIITDGKQTKTITRD